MKKLASFLLVLAMILSMGTLAFADGTTTLSTTVPAAQYTLNIPADQTIPFGATSTEIGNVTVSDSSGFAKGKNLNVTVAYDAFSSADVSTTIPFELVMCGVKNDGSSAYKTKNSRQEGLLYLGAYFPAALNPNHSFSITETLPQEMSMMYILDSSKSPCSVPIGARLSAVTTRHR